MIRLTYVAFVVLFVCPPILVLAVRLHRGRSLPPGYRWGIPAMLVLGPLYTVPWASTLIGRGVWSYDASIVITRLAAIPLGEYLFIVLEILLVGLWTAVVAPSRIGQLRLTGRDRVLGVLAAVAVGAVGWALHGGSTLYFGSTLLWAAPVLGLQWGAGWPVLLSVGRRFAIAVVVPAGYLIATDLIAIRAGMWQFSPRFTTGTIVGGLPIEEGVFFVLTSLFVVQGLLLLQWTVESSG